jgi:pentapeptide repeat protein
MAGAANATSLSGLLGIIQRAQRAVPAVKYALGVVGIAAAAAATSILLGHTRTSIISVALMLAGMVVLFVFAKLVAGGASRSVHAAANVVLWTVVLIFSAALVCGFLAVVARWPPALVEFMFPKSEQSIPELLQKVITRDNVTSAQGAVAEIARRCEKDCAEKENITKTLALAVRNTGHLDRELNVTIVAALKRLWNNDLTSVLDSDLEGTELVEVDFSRANMTGLSLKGAFILLSKFQGVNLTDADLTNASIRGSDFRNAILKNTMLTNADWFNSFNVDKKQLEMAAGDLLKCPPQFADPSFRPFIEYVNANYGIHFENYGTAHKHDLEDHWKKYSARGGLCEMVEQRSNQ